MSIKITTPNAGAQNQSYFLNTSIDQRIYAVNGGAELFPVTLLPRILHIQHQSIKNLIAKGQFPIPIVKFAGRNYVKTETLVKYLHDCELQGIRPRKLAGRKTNRQRLEANHAESFQPEPLHGSSKGGQL